jgi:hypothetical protein
MALIVEDGTGRSDAESYISAVDATNYFIKMGKGDDWDLVDDQEAALRRATQYMLSVYRPRWAGSRYKAAQALDWPRVDVPIKDVASGYGGYPPYYSANIIPPEVKNACAELALKTVDNPDLIVDETAAIKQETVGPITTIYENGASAQTTYSAVDAMLRMLFADGGSSISVYRA